MEKTHEEKNQIVSVTHGFVDGTSFPPFFSSLRRISDEALCLQMQQCLEGLATGRCLSPGLGHALTYHSDNLKICWLKKCSPGLISDVYISLFEKWRSSSQLCYVSFTRGVIEKGGLFPGVGTNTRICLHVYIGAGGMPVFLSANIASGT